MPFYEDLSVYEYGPDTRDVHILNVGWLSEGRDFPVGGDLPIGFTDRLARLALRHPANRMRGWHACPFCEEAYPVQIAVDGERQPVGDAEIRVSEPGGQVYAAPTLVVHYVAGHGYRPPNEFVMAVLADPRASSNT